MTPHRLILLGPPGSGKGTQSAFLALELRVVHISTGEILREAVRRDFPLGREASTYIRSGKLVPDEIVMKIVEERLQEKDCGLGFLLDGYPRTIPQAKMLDARGPKIETVISLKITEEECVRRLANRKSCSRCGLTYNPATHPPKKENVCDQCGSQLSLREDDRPETVKERFKVYTRQTEPLIAYYQRSQRLSEVDGSLPPKKVLENVKNMLEYKIYPRP